MSKPKAGEVAQQQAMIKYLGLSYRKAAEVTGVNHRTIWQHVAAGSGSNVAAWEDRPEEVQEQAIELAQMQINRHVLRNR